MLIEEADKLSIGKQQAITESSPERVIQNYSSGEKKYKKY